MLLALALFLVGIFAPSIVVTELGNLRRLSLLDGIQVLWSTGHTFLAAIIFLFTILFPPAKLVLTAAAATPTVPLSPTTRRRLRSVVEALGRWSLLDVMVIAILIVAIKVHGFVSVQATWGIYVFMVSILLSILATQLLKTGRSNVSHRRRSVLPTGPGSALRCGLTRRSKIMPIFGVALILVGTGWLILVPSPNVEKVFVTKKQTFVELPRFFGNPSFYVRVQTLNGIQRLNTKPRTPIGNGLVWTLEKPVSLTDLYELEIFEEGLLTDKLVDRVSVVGRRVLGERFQFELQGQKDWQWSASLVTAAAGIGLVIFEWRRRKTNRKPTPDQPTNHVLT